MTRQARVVVGVTVLIVAVVVVAVFVQKVEEVGVWLWLVPLALVVAAGYLAYRYPSVRTGLRETGVFLANAVGEVFRDEGTSKRKAERTAIPAAMRQAVMARAHNRCQYKGCSVSNKRMLDIHHIDMNPTNSDDPSNLLVVCGNHHKALHSEGRSKAQVRGWAQGKYGRARRRTAKS